MASSIDREKTNQSSDDANQYLHNLVYGDIDFKPKTGFVSYKDGLGALDSFLAGNINYDDLMPFSLPVRYRSDPNSNFSLFEYYMGKLSRITDSFRFYLANDQLIFLHEELYVIPRREISRGQNPYYWLEIYAASESDSSVLTSCRLRPGVGKHKIDFKTWHGLGEQLLTDYIIGTNNLRFTDLLPFNLEPPNRKHLKDYYLGGVTSLTPINIRNIEDLQSGDFLRFVPKTDDQKLYEWLDVLKGSNSIPEEKWPLISSYRILASSHRIYSAGWFGSERQLLIDRIQGISGIGFENLRPIRSVATIKNGRIVCLFDSRLANLRFEFHLKSGVLEKGGETISVPRRDEQGIYEWVELYRFNQASNNATGEILATARITSEGSNQKQWAGANMQFLKDYSQGKVSFDYLKPVSIRIGKRTTLVHLWVDAKEIINLVIPRSLKLQSGDELILMPENEVINGADFLLIKDRVSFARYRLDVGRKKFTLINYLATQDQPGRDELCQ